MPDLFVDISVDTAPTLEYLNRVLSRVCDMRSYFASDLDPIIRDIVRKNFEAGGRPPWKPRKGEKEYGGILKKSGKLRQAALNPTLTMDAAKAVWTAHVGEGGVAHHYGVERNVSIGEHTRKITEAFGKKLRNPKSFTVKSHTVKMHLPSRPFFCIPLGYGEPERIKQSAVNYIFKGL